MKIGNFKMQILGSDLVVQRFPFGHMVKTFALYYKGMVPRSGSFNGLAEVQISIKQPQSTKRKGRDLSFWRCQPDRRNRLDHGQNLGERFRRKKP